MFLKKTEITEDLRTHIKKWRDAIRYHRDQKGDARCWLDDYLIWNFIAGSPKDPETLADVGGGMAQCRDFYTHRRAETPDQTPENAVLDEKLWDIDLETMSHDNLLSQLDILRTATQIHRDIHGRSRIIEDDRLLYNVLPEHLPADFRLPPEQVMLGTAEPGIGCPAFWKSHECCAKKHNFHQWGPCQKSI